ncbi:hypothetical protein BDQ12DRAFT_665702 [Crucibulum laeve]|uniref:Uncharacterized protein n=1 Tax=Crucibulum laeve TaxID=68775 RepID=A0A5C3MCM8_9AGAR|nr:hypothetical protein BDQ12DRAFT_665702 [Crucibulum laeve]
MALCMSTDTLLYILLKSSASMSVQISTISAKVPPDSKTHRYFVEAKLSSERIAKKKFKKRNELAQYRFNPSYSLCDGATIKIQIIKKHRLYKDEVVIETDFTTEIAQKLLGKENTLTDQVLSSLDTKFEILLSFSVSPSASHDLIEAAVGRQFLDTLMGVAVAVSGVRSHEFPR